jgi:hypothetical protein
MVRMNYFALVVAVIAAFVASSLCTVLSCLASRLWN